MANSRSFHMFGKGSVLGGGFFATRPDPHHYYKLAIKLALGSDIEKKDSARYCHKAAELGHLEAQHLMGLFLKEGEIVPRDLNASFGWFSKAAAKGLAKSQYAVARCYKHGEGIQKDQNKYVHWLSLAAKNGDKGAQGQLGIYCYDEKNGKEALSWFRRAAEQGCAQAQYNVACSLFYGEHGVEKDEKESFVWYAKSAAQNDAGAQRMMGLCLLNGHGVPPDEKAAIQWLRKSAEQGEVFAQTHLANLLIKDENSEEEAVDLYRKAMSKNHLEAFLCFANFLREGGRVIKKDEKEALRLMQYAAQQGQKHAQTMMGLFFERGIGGVTKDLTTAANWYELAAKQNPEINNLIERVEREVAARYP